MTLGDLVVSQNLRDWQSPLHFTVSMAVGDNDFTAGPEEFTIVINNTRQPPYIVNLDATLTIPEDAANGIIFTVSKILIYVKVVTAALFFFLLTQTIHAQVQNVPLKNLYMDVTLDCHNSQGT